MPLVALVILGLVACSPDPQALVHEDVAYLRRAIFENYPYLDVHLRRDHLDWVEHFETSLKNEPVRFSGVNQLEYLSQFLAGLNGNVRILDPEEYADFSKTINPIAESYPEYGVWGEVLA